MPKILAALALLLVTGCAPTLHGGGDRADFDATISACARENWNWAFALIPDFGSTAEFHRDKCTKQRGWTKAPGHAWAWTGPGAIQQLYRFKDDIDVVGLVCPYGKRCQPVTLTTEPAEWIAWTFEAWPQSDASRQDVPVIGDEAQCERVRQSDTALGVTTRLCRGPVYFKRADAIGVAAPPSMPPTPATVPAPKPAQTEPTWATGL